MLSPMSPRRALTLLASLAIAACLAAGCKNTCEEMCQRQLGCRGRADPPSASRAGEECAGRCQSGAYAPSEACLSCVNASLCVPEGLSDGGRAWVATGCEEQCPPLP